MHATLRCLLFAAIDHTQSAATDSVTTRQFTPTGKKILHPSGEQRIQMVDMIIASFSLVLSGHRPPDPSQNATVDRVADARNSTWNSRERVAEMLGCKDKAQH